METTTFLRVKTDLNQKNNCQEIRYVNGGAMQAAAGFGKQYKPLHTRCCFADCNWVPRRTETATGCVAE